MSFDKRLGVALLAAMVLGCTTSSQGETSTLGPPPPCTSKFCNNPAGGGSETTGSGGGSGTGGSTGTGTSTGAINGDGFVNRIVSEDFLGGTPYTGAVTIEAPGPGGAQVSVMYGGPGTGGAGGEMPFVLDGVESGNDWVIVADDSQGAEGILSTFSTQDLSTAPTTLPVMDLGTLQMIADGLPSLAMTGGVSTLASQIILTVLEGGSPAAGVTLSGDPIGGSIVYDTGDGVYDDTATATGMGGTIIVFNAALSGTATLTLTYTPTGTTTPVTQMVPIQGAAGTATFVKGLSLD